MLMTIFETIWYITFNDGFKIKIAEPIWFIADIAIIVLIALVGLINKAED